jgi:two-component system response regulator AtoC
MGLSIGSITREAQEALLGYQWRGNVREIQNVVERAMILTIGDSITLDSLPYDIRVSGTRVICYTGDDESLSLKKACKDLEKTLIARALNRTGGNRSRAAVLLEISYPSLLQKIKEYGVV